jgi:hypothetical protein
MLGWTMLLFWAYRRPVERRFVAALTMVVISGLILTEVIAVRFSVVEARRMVPTWCLQVLQLVLFARAYYFVPARSKS